MERAPEHARFVARGLGLAQNGDLGVRTGERVARLFQLLLALVVRNFVIGARRLLLLLLELLLEALLERVTLLSSGDKRGARLLKLRAQLGLSSRSGIGSGSGSGSGSSGDIGADGLSAWLWLCEELLELLHSISDAQQLHADGRLLERYFVHFFFPLSFSALKLSFRISELR